MTTSTFRSLELNADILSAVGRAGYTRPTEIQEKTIPALISGRDVLATAQTGTGKTAAFVLPMLQRDAHASKNGAPRHARGGAAAPAALILTPTRELAAQIEDSITTYGRGSRMRAVAVFGGASKHRQLTQLREAPEIIVATPGRLMDFMSEGVIDLSRVNYLVLDEADRMLDMGFIPAVRKIVSHVPSRHQTALFSATMPEPIRKLAAEMLQDPVRIQAESGSLTVKAINQSVLHINQADKLAALPGLIRDRGMYKVLVFTRTKHRASKVAKRLLKEKLPSDAIHGDKSQNARIRALEAFRNGRIQVLVATDVASRGIDVDDVTHVINFELPNEAETYVHRIGRTGRAGAAGEAISLCDDAEKKYLRSIERLTGVRLRVDNGDRYQASPAVSGGRYV